MVFIICRGCLDGQRTIYAFWPLWSWSIATIIEFQIPIILSLKLAGPVPQFINDDTLTPGYPTSWARKDVKSLDKLDIIWQYQTKHDLKISLFYFILL